MRSRIGPKSMREPHRFDLSAPWLCVSRPSAAIPTASTSTTRCSLYGRAAECGGLENRTSASALVHGRSPRRDSLVIPCAGVRPHALRSTG